MDVLLQGNLWPYDWIQSCFGQHIKGIFQAADWPDCRRSAESAERVRSHRPAPNPLYCSQGGALRMKTRLGAADTVPHTVWRIRPKGCFLSLLLHISTRETVRKCWFRTCLDSELIGVTGNIGGLRSQQRALQCNPEKEEKNQACGSERDCQGVGHPLVQKSRCRSLPKNSKIPMLWPTGRLQNLLHVNNVSKSPPTILSIKNLETFKLGQPWEYKPHVFLS